MPYTEEETVITANWGVLAWGWTAKCQPVCFVFPVSFQNLPPVLQNYRNPCWYEAIPESFQYRDNYYYEENSGHVRQVFDQLEDIRHKTNESVRLRCYPSVYLLGMPKCGTTYFFSLIREFIEGLVTGVFKETQYWARRRFAARPGVNGTRKTGCV